MEDIRNTALEEQMKWGQETGGKWVQELQSNRKISPLLARNYLFHFQDNAVWIPIQILFAMHLLALILHLWMCFTCADLKTVPTLLKDFHLEFSSRCQETYTTKSLVFLSVGKTDNKLWDLTNQCLILWKKIKYIVFLTHGW